LSPRPGQSFAVGVVAAIALGIIALGVFLVGREQRFWEGRIDYWLQFSRTNGLVVGAPVLLDGVSVGSVESMHFPADPAARYVQVRISVADDVANRIRRDTLGRVQTLGLLGDKYIELTSGTLQAEPVEPEGLLRSIDPVDYEALLGQSGDVVTNVIEVTALLRQVLSDIDKGEGLIGRLVSDDDLATSVSEDLRAAVANVETATRRLDEVMVRVQTGKGALGSLVSEEHDLAQSLTRLETASENMLEFSDRLVHGRGALARLTTDEEFAEKTLGNLERATTSVAEIADQVRSGGGTLGKLVYDDGLYTKSEALVGGSGGIWGLLWRFLWPFGSGGGGGEESSNAARRDAERNASPEVEESPADGTAQTPRQPQRSGRPQDRFAP
jgi:phospholipid/cholesterol/gamma-HCH transport system substrate-binding protein